MDGVSEASDEALLGHTRQFISERLQAADFHPDSWPPVVIRDPKEARQKLALVAGDKYSYREMDDFTDLIEKGLKSVPQATKVSRSGILAERDLSPLLPGAHRLLRPAARRPAEHPGRAQHHAGRRSTGSRGEEPFHRPFRRV